MFEGNILVLQKANCEMHFQMWLMNSFLLVFQFFQKKIYCFIERSQMEPNYDEVTYH